MSEIKLKACPFCGRMPYIQLTDEEGNHRQQAYLDNSYSGVGYVLCHTDKSDINDCPIATSEGEDLGNLIYDTEDEAAEYWNKRIDGGGQ